MGWPGFRFRNASSGGNEWFLGRVVFGGGSGFRSKAGFRGGVGLMVV